MISLHRFEHLRLAQAFSDYLNSQKISNTIQHSEFSYEILLEQEQQLHIAEKALAEFLANPTQSKYLSASWESGDLKSTPDQLSYANADLFSNFKRQAGILTHSLFAICFEWDSLRILPRLFLQYAVVALARAIFHKRILNVGWYC